MERVVMILLVSFTAAAVRADEASRISALEARVATLESLQRSLATAMESVSGRSLAELVEGVTDAPAAVAIIPVKTTIAPAGERLVQGMPESQARARLAELEAHLGSLTEAGKASTPREREIARLRSQVETLRESLQTW